MKMLKLFTPMATGFRHLSNDIKSISVAALTSSASMDQLQFDSSKIVKAYSALPLEAKRDYINFLAESCAVSHEQLKQAIAKYEKNSMAVIDVQTASVPRYSRLFQAIGNLEHGVKFVCDFRADVLAALKNPELKQDQVRLLRRLEASLKDILTLWFCLSNLKLRRLTWQTPADILQKVAAGEAVHPVHGLVDMKRRLGPCRRCFIFLHEAMPREPLVMVYVALTNGISDSVQKIVKEEKVDEEAELTADTAIYYSITSTQPGLRGIDLGNLMIKQVAAELMKESPNVVHHSTLSPIPGFRSWLLRSLKGHSEFGDVVNPVTLNLLRSFPNLEAASPEELKANLIRLIETNDIEKYALLKDLFLHFAALYLTKAKNSHGYVLNPVANFHLRNGAEIYRLNFGGDVSRRGMEASLGLMVNYRYVLENVGGNHRNYVNDKVVALGDEFRKQYSQILDSAAKL